MHFIFFVYCFIEKKIYFYILFRNRVLYTQISDKSENAGPEKCQQSKHCVFSSGIITGLSIFGPAVAYGLGGVFSQIYVTLEGKSSILISFLTFSSLL